MELQEFIQQLNKNSSWVKTTLEITRDVMLQLNNSRQPLDIIASIPSVLPTRTEDIILLDSPSALGAHVGKKFEKPLLYRHAPNTGPPGGRELSLDTFLAYLQEQPEALIDAYDYSIDEPSERTYRMSISNILRHWEQDSDKRHAINLLDIENRIADFCPNEIIQYDLENRLDRFGPGSIGKTDSNWQNSRREFFLLSGANAISSIHVDNAGQLTWIRILHGRKIWYFPREISNRALQWLAIMGSQYTKGYKEGWVRVELRAGDLLVLPPSCPHAVFTPEDCLAVGGHFYTAAHLGSTLVGLKHQEDHPDICNEDLEPRFFTLLERLLTKFDYLGCFEEQADVLSSSTLFLDDINAVFIAEAFKKPRSKGSSRTAALEVPAQLKSRFVYLFMSERAMFIKALEGLKHRLLEKWEN